MPPIEDFFAFGGTDFASPQLEATPSKKKRKVKKKTKPKSEVTSTALSSKTEHNVQTLPQTPSSHEAVEDPKLATEVNTSAIADLLGLSSSLPILNEPQPENSINDRHERLKNRTGNTNNNNNMADTKINDEDNFLSSIDDFVNTIKEKGTEIQSLIETYQQSTVEINGEKIPAKSVVFELHLDIHAAGQVSGPYDMQVKGSTKISKIINKIMGLFNNVASPTFPETEWNELALYVSDINVVFNQSLRCTSLLTYQGQLSKSDIVKGFNVYGIITTDENARLLYANERAKKMSAVKTEDEEEEDNENGLYNVEIEDTIRGGTNSVSVVSNMSVSELLFMYKYKMKLPSELDLKVQKEDKFLNVDESLKINEVVKNTVLKVTYSLEELSKLEEEMKSKAANEGEDDEDDDDDEDIDVATKGNEVQEIGSGGNNEEYFTIFIAGKDKKRYKVRVKPSTKISEISTFYKNKAGITENTSLKLLFDDEEMDMDGVVADTELEEDFMIDVIV